MQLSEGPEDEVQALYRRIVRDPRHVEVTQI
ncbi:BLUF domain-containing protein [Aureimonas altamirensis]